MLRFQIRSFEADLLQAVFHDRLQTARADVFSLLIHLRAKLAIESIASAVNSIVTPSVSIIA
jgi:hypothetical protein